MGSFNQHIACSTITGVCLGGIVYQFGFSIPVCLLSAGLCSMAGMLPDIDSDSSRSFQECIYFAAGLCAVLLVNRLKLFDIDRDTVLLAGAAMFMFVRFGIGSMVKRITAHRGMFHSIPAAVFAGQIVFFLSSGTITERLCKSAALIAGYLSHLILDEICSIDSTGQSLRLKKSSGTALKFYDPKKLGTSLSLYAVIIGLAFFAVKNPVLLDGSESLESRIRLALEDSLVQVVNVPLVKKTATIQEQMQEENSNSGVYAASDASNNHKNMDFQLFSKNSSVEDVNIPIFTETAAGRLRSVSEETTALPFTIPQQTDQTAVMLPFEIPADTAVNSAPQLPFSLPF